MFQMPSFQSCTVKRALIEQTLNMKKKPDPVSSFFPNSEILATHPALPLWEETGSSSPGGRSSPLLLSDASLRSPPHQDTISSHPCILHCLLLLGQLVLGHSRLLIFGLPFRVTLLSIFWPYSCLYHDSLTHFGITFGPYRQPLLSSSFQVSRLYLGQHAFGY